MMNSGDTDPTFIETNIPWVMRCIGDDRQQSYLLVDYLYRKLDLQRVGIIRASNRYGRFGVREIRDSSRRLRKAHCRSRWPMRVGAEDFSLQIEPAEGGQGRRHRPLGRRRRRGASSSTRCGPRA